MRKFGFVLSSLFILSMIHISFFRYASFMGIQTNINFLFVLASGFLLGPVLGETIGFVFGITSDALGSHLFGYQALLFSLVGYIAGKLRRRVDCERPTPQVIVAFVGTLIYLGLGKIVRVSLDSTGMHTSAWMILLQALLNGVLMPFIFWFSNWWIWIWKLGETN